MDTNNDITESSEPNSPEQILSKYVRQFCFPKAFKNTEMAGFSSILSNICSVCCQNDSLLELLFQDEKFMEKFSHDWTNLVHKYCSNKFYSKNDGLHFRAAISLVKTLTDFSISLVVSSTNWEALLFEHLDLLALKRHYVIEYLTLARNFLCFRYASRSPDIKGHKNLMETVYKCVQNDSVRVSLYAALNLFSFSPELQFSPEFRDEMGQVHELGKEIFRKIEESLIDGSALQDREIVWIEEINVYLSNVGLYNQKRHLIRQIGDFLIETKFLQLAATTLDHIVLRPSSDGNVLKLLGGTFNVSGLLQILWTLDESLLFSHYFHHTNLGIKLVRLLNYLLSSGISRKDYDRTICEILKSVRLNCLNNTELKEEFYAAQILTVFEKNLPAILQKQAGDGVAFIAIYICAILGNPEEVAECLHNKANVKVVASVCQAITTGNMRLEVENFGTVEFGEVLEVLQAYERDKGLQLVADSSVVDNLVSTLEIEDFPKEQLRNVTGILFGLSLVEICQESLIKRKVYDIAFKVKKEINDAQSLRNLAGIIWQLSGSYEFEEYEIAPPDNKISVFICAAEKDKNWRKKFGDILALKGFQIVNEESIKSVQLQIQTEFDANASKDKESFSSKLERFEHLNKNKDAPSWALAIAESHLVIAAMTVNLEKDKFCRMQIQFGKQLEKDIRYIDVNENDYNPQNWLFEAMQRCPLYDSVNQIKTENIFEHYNRANDQQQNRSEETSNEGVKSGRKDKARARRHSLITPMTPRGGIEMVSQWTVEDVQQWLDLIKVPKAKPIFQAFSGVELSQLKDRCQENATEFGEYLRDTYHLDLYSRKKLKLALLEM